MKNQYFGDIRDLFKFDLIENLSDEIRLERLTYIPMLTPNNDKNEGSNRKFAKAKAGYKNKCLVRFLESLHKIPKEQRDIIKIKEYFEGIGIKISIYDEGNYFTGQGRGSYFNDISLSLLYDALIFLDPDNGMEVKDSVERHVFYSEIKGMYQKMKNSLLVVIQFSKPVDNKEFWTYDLYRRSSELISNAKIDTPPIFVADNKIAFFILTKGLSFKNLTSKTILKYKNQYPELIIGNLLI